jgi:glycosyltransferase involved in cell wall biosynthesis
MTISLVLPTKNRPRDVAVAIRSVLRQTRLPKELIVIDQSEERDTERVVRDELAAAASRSVHLAVRYERDPRIRGANAARNAGLRLATGEIVGVIEDDIVLEREALERLHDAYVRHPELVGMSGVITNYHPPVLAFRLFDRLFSLGPFFDDRQPLYWRSDAYRPGDVVRVTQMGGLMTFRAEAVAGLAFDASVKKLRVRGEDRDFCFAVARRVGRGRRVFGMAMGSRLTHNPSPVGRFRGRAEELNIASQHYFYSRHLRGSAINALLYAWWNVGLGLSAAVAAARGLSIEPLRSVVRGWRHVRQGYVLETTVPDGRHGDVYA